MISTRLNMPLDRLPATEGVYIVGGTTRDLLLGKPPVDYDIAVFQNPEVFAKKAAAMNRGRLIPMGRPGKRSFRVMAGSMILDITAINGPTIRDDLARRDVTINAMAIELSSGTLFDWQGGRRDLEAKKIRMVSEKSFRDDPIRLLRAFRLAAVLGFTIDPQTLSAIEKHAERIQLAAGERIRSELHRLLTCADSYPQVTRMAGTGLLRAIFPVQPPTTEKTAEHTKAPDRFLKTYETLETLIHHPPQDLLPRGMAHASLIPPGQRVWLKFARLMGRHHRESKAAVTNTACRRLRLSNRERKFVSGIVDNQSLPFHLHEAFTRGRLTPRDAIRFFMTVDELTPPLLMNAWADAFDQVTFPAFARHLLHLYYGTYLPGKSSPPLLSGRDLKNALGLPPSPLLKRILVRLEEGRISGDLTDRASALRAAERLARKSGSG